MLVLAALLAVCPARAALMPIEFAGSAGDVSLSGGLLLDDAAWSITTYESGTGQQGVLASPWQWIRGTFGAFEFNGIATLVVGDYPNERIYDNNHDHWIVRSVLSSNVVDGISMTYLSIEKYVFSYLPERVAPEMLSVIPPITLAPFSFYATFSDGTFASGHLTATPVPEPETLTLLAIGALSVWLSRRRSIAK